MQHRAADDSRPDAQMRQVLVRANRILDRCRMDISYLGNRLRRLQSVVDTIEDMTLAQGEQAMPHRGGRSSNPRTSHFTIDLVQIALPPLLAFIFRTLLEHAGSSPSDGSGGWVQIDTLKEGVERKLRGTSSRHNVVNAVYRLRQRLFLAGLDGTCIEQNDAKGYRFRIDKVAYRASSQA